MKKNKDTVRPFHCGTQYGDWIDVNCCACKKGYREGETREDCDLELALVYACFCDGEVSKEIAKRLGVPDDCTVYNWRCTEFEEEPIGKEVV